MSDDYNVFISWSGPRSHWVAKAMMEWLPVVLQSVKPWMSSSSIDKGTRSANEISDALRSVKMGIVCLTPDNLLEPWLLFEAGALSNAAAAQKTYVCTYLLGGLTTSQIAKPLGEFQHTSPTKEDTLHLLHTMNGALGNSISDKVLDNSFEGQWPSFEEKLKTMPSEGEGEAVKRGSDDMLAEILENTRAQGDHLRLLQSLITQTKSEQRRMHNESNRFAMMINRMNAVGVSPPGDPNNSLASLDPTPPNLEEIKKTIQEVRDRLGAWEEADKEPKS